MRIDYFVFHFNPAHHIHSFRDTALHKTGNLKDSSVGLRSSPRVLEAMHNHVATLI